MVNIFILVFLYYYNCIGTKILNKEINIFFKVDDYLIYDIKYINKEKIKQFNAKSAPYF